MTPADACVRVTKYQPPRTKAETTMKKSVNAVIRGAIPGHADPRPLYLSLACGAESPTWTYERRLATMFSTQDDAIAACAVPLRNGVAVSIEYVREGA